MASRWVLYIFQLPAMIGLGGTLPPGGWLAARHPNLQRDQTGKLLALEEFEHRSPARRCVVDLVSVREVVDLGDAHGTVPHDGLGLVDVAREGSNGLEPDVVAAHGRGDLIRGE